MTTNPGANILSHHHQSGSLDSDIKPDATPNDLEAFLAAHPSIERVCLASGGTTADLFKRHHKRWLQRPGEWTLADDNVTRAKFGKLVSERSLEVRPVAHYRPPPSPSRHPTPRHPTPLGHSPPPTYPPAHSPKVPEDNEFDARARELCVMPSVSPAAAGIPYAVKREGWLTHCYRGDVTEETWERHRRNSDPT